MDNKLELLNTILAEYGDVKISKVIQILEAEQEKPKSLKEIKIKGNHHNGRGCYECSGEHGSIWANNLFEFLIDEFEYIHGKDESYCKITNSIANEFAKMIINGFLGSDYYTSYDFKLSHKLSVKELSSMITNELSLDCYDIEDIEDDGFEKWYKNKCEW